MKKGELYRNNFSRKIIFIVDTAKNKLGQEIVDYYFLEDPSKIYWFFVRDEILRGDWEKL